VGIERLSAVADAGPLIHLAEIDCLALLSIFDELHIPDAVWQEATSPDRVSSADLSRSLHVVRHSVSATDVGQFVTNRKLQRLHIGERESLYLSTQLEVPLLLTDDLAVRDSARALGLTPVGSLGVVTKALRLGEISQEQAERHISDLYDVSTLFVTKTIVEMAIEHLRTAEVAATRTPDPAT